MRLRGVSDLEVDLPNLQSSVPNDRGEVGVEGALGLGLQLGENISLETPSLDGCKLQKYTYSQPKCSRA